MHSQTAVNSFLPPNREDILDSPENECDMLQLLESVGKCLTPENMLKVIDTVKPMITVLEKAQKRKQQAKKRLPRTKATSSSDSTSAASIMHTNPRQARDTLLKEVFGVHENTAHKRNVH